MADFWNTLTAILKAILDFMDWYIEDTPLFPDTLTAFYNLGQKCYEILTPLIGEYVYLINEYIHGGID